MLAFETLVTLNLGEARRALRLHGQARFVGHEERDEGALAGAQQGAGRNFRIERQGAPVHAHITLQRHDARGAGFDAQPAFGNPQLRTDRDAQGVDAAVMDLQALPAEGCGEEALFKAAQGIAGAGRVNDLEIGRKRAPAGQQACSNAKNSEGVANHGRYLSDLLGEIY